MALGRSSEGEGRTLNEQASAAHESAEVRSDLTKLARSGALNAVGMVSNAVFAFVLAVVITRALHAEGAGVFFEAIAVFMIATTLGQLGADVGVVRTIPRYLVLGRRQDARAFLPLALSPVVLASSALATVLFVFAPELSDVMIRGDDNDAVVPYLRVLAPFLPLAAASKVVLSATRGFGTMVPFIAVEYVGKAMLRPALAVVAVVAGLGEVGVALSWGIPIALGLVAAVVWLVYLVRRPQQEDVEEGTETPRRELAHEFWRFTSFRGAAAVLDVSVLWLGVLLVGALSSAAEAGVYAAATRLVTVGSFALHAVFLVFGPQISALLAEGSHERASKLYQTATAWLTAISFPIYITMAVYPTFFLEVFGSDFEQGATPLVILALVMLVNMSTGPVGVVLLMAGKSFWNLANTTLALTVNVILSLILIPRFGITGAALAWAVSILIQNLLPLGQIWFSLRLQPFSLGYLVAASGAGLCFGVIGLLAKGAFGDSAAAFAVFVAAASTAYLALLWRSREALSLAVLVQALRRKGPWIASRPSEARL